MNRIKLLLILIATSAGAAAQQGFPVTDQQPVTIEGLNCGYHIKSLETKQVGDKGNFSRYSISFFVTNVSNEPRVFYYRQGPTGLNAVSDLLVQFNCLNATGARLTNKYAVLHATPYRVFRDRQVVPMGYSIMPGQTITADCIMIVPLNQPLNMVVYYIGYQQQLVPWSAAVPASQAVVYNEQSAAPALPMPALQGYLQIRSIFNNTFVNNQTGGISCTPIKTGWWSAQWQFIPVQGTNMFKIQNRWRSNFISVQNGYIMLSADGRDDGGNWLVEPTSQPNVFRIKNMRNNSYLSVISSQITLQPGMDNNPGLLWGIQ